MKEDRNERPKWPKTLPPPIGFMEGARQVYLSHEDIGTVLSIPDLIEDMYWFDSDEFYLYFPYGKGLGVELKDKLEANGIELKKTEMYFYRHPKPGYKNDFIRSHAARRYGRMEAGRGKFTNACSNYFDTCTLEKKRDGYSEHCERGCGANKHRRINYRCKTLVEKQLEMVNRHIRFCYRNYCRCCSGIMAKSSNQSINNKR